MAELLGHPVDEHSQARRQLPRMGVEDVDRQRRRWKTGQHLDQRAAGKLGSDAIARHLDQPEAHAGARDIGLGTGHRYAGRMPPSRACLVPPRLGCLAPQAACFLDRQLNEATGIPYEGFSEDHALKPRSSSFGFAQ